MKNKKSTQKRLLSTFCSGVLLSAICLTPTITPLAANTLGGGGDEKTSAKTFAPLVDTTTTASNTTPIVIPENPALPTLYPSPITIAGTVGKITNVTLSINNLSVVRPRDLDMLLVSPGGQKFVFFSDAGGVLVPANTTNVTITLSDAAVTFLPDNQTGNTALSSGTFKPTNNDSTDVFPAPAPAAPYNFAANNPAGTASPGTATFASVYAQPGVAANGVWNLYVLDDAGGGAGGTIAGGWTLNVTTNNVASTAAEAGVRGRVVNSQNIGIAGAKVVMTEPNGATRQAVTNSFGYYTFTGVTVGAIYVFNVSARRYPARTVVTVVNEDLADFDINLDE